MAHTFKNGLNVVFKPFFHAFDSFFVNSFSDKSADAFKIFVRERLLFMDKFQFIELIFVKIALSTTCTSSEYTRTPSLV